MYEAPVTSPGTRNVDLAHVAHVLRERKWLILALVVVAVAASGYLSMRSTPLYSATSKVLRENTTLDQAIFGAQIFDVQDQQRALDTGANLIKTADVAQMVKKDLNSPRSPSSLKNMLAVGPSSSADIISITATSANPQEAANVANSFARQFIIFRQNQDRAILTAARNDLQGQLDGMTANEKSSTAGLTLSQKIEELTVLESMQTGGFEFAEEATVPSSPFSPRPYRNAAIALVLGLIIGLVAAFLVDFFDRRIKDEDTVQREFGASVLASIPRIGWGSNGNHSKRSIAAVGFTHGGSPVLEAFRTLRSNLKFFQIDRSIRTILVTSALPREGKTVSTINLALSLAMSGSRVLILEADLRRPLIQKYLGLNGQLGFTNLLAGTHSIAEVVQVIDAESLLPHDASAQAPAPADESPSKKGLLCIAAGPLPPNPAELLAMPRFGDVLREISSFCDYVIVDAPPLLLVSDALEIAKKVDAVVMVVRIRSTTVDEARKARQSLGKVGVMPLGVVVNGVSRAKTYYRRYGGYYVKT